MNSSNLSFFIIKRKAALGDTLAIAPFYNYLLSQGIDVFLDTNDDYKFYHKKVKFINDTEYSNKKFSESWGYLDLEKEDLKNPFIPIYLLGFYKLNIPVTKDLDFSIEHNYIKTTKPYIVTANSPLYLKSRRACFDLPEELSKKYEIIHLKEHIEKSKFIEIIKNATCVIGRDGASMHLAQAYDVPFIAIMSSVMGDLRYPKGITLYETCPYKTQFCYHTHWDSKDCPTQDYYPPCGIISKEKILTALKKLNIL